MAQLKNLLIEQLQKLLFAEERLPGALAQMARASHNPKLQEGFEKHITQTEEHANRLRQAFQSIGAPAEAQTCKAILGLIAAGESTIEEGKQKDPVIADLALIAAAQNVEHYEISSYGTARTLARQLGDTQIAALLSRTLGEEESTDHLLTEMAKPLVQQATAAEMTMAGA
jgi:Mn-containing catalase